jgi:hypothetical protein
MMFYGLKHKKWQIGTAALALLIGIGAAFWLKTEVPAVPGASNITELSESKEFTPEPYFPNRDLGIKSPLDVKINLLNNPQFTGDVAELELMLTSRLEDARVEAQYLFPAGVNRMGGETEWSGALSLNETKRLRMIVAIETEEPRSIQAKVTATKGNYQFTRGAAYHIDLGEKDYAESVEIPISGYEGGQKLNLIVPAEKK